MIGVGWRVGGPGHRKEWPWENWLRQVGTCQADPGGLWGEGRGFLQIQLPPHCAENGGSREAGGALD